MLTGKPYDSQSEVPNTPDNVRVIDRMLELNNVAPSNVVEISPLAMARVNCAVDRAMKLNAAVTQAKFVLCDLKLELKLCVHAEDKRGMERIERAIVLQQRVVEFLDMMEKQGVGL